MGELPRQIKRLMERKQKKIEAKKQLCRKCNNKIEHPNKTNLCKRCLSKHGINLKSGALTVYS